MKSPHLKVLAVFAGSVLLVTGCVNSHRARQAVVVTPAVVTPEGYVVETAPPVPHVETKGASPGEGYAWVPGYWANADNRWVWIPGNWQSAKPGEVWIAGRWDRTDKGWAWVPGHWEGTAVGGAEQP